MQKINVESQSVRKNGIRWTEAIALLRVITWSVTIIAGQPTDMPTHQMVKSHTCQIC